RQTNPWFDGGMLVVRMTFMIGIGYIVSYLVTEQRQQRSELAEANRKLTRFAAAQEQLATVRERNRLARELHDTLAHTLSALTVQLEALTAVWQPETPRAQHFLATALSTAREGLDETRRALQDLRAAPLDDLGLVLVIRNLAESVARRGALKLDLDLPEDLGNLPPDVENAFYRLAQEALENIVKHAGAKSVDVSLRQDGAHLTLVVADDGRGFLTGLTETDERFGIRGMRERAAQIGGTLDITTQPEAGTVVRLSCAVKDQGYD
ncbi:MAG: sensor histidine kinase, partial [Anaerolineae bacterium]|nr:sensor histidine kinase [Anaerolineae bacterium]